MALDGSWFSHDAKEELQLRGTIKGLQIELPNRDIVKCDKVTDTALQVTFGTEVFTATLKGKELVWSDGDKWIRSDTEKLRELFKQADVDNSGAISRKEMEKLFKTGDWSDAEFDLMFKQVDQDGSGSIDYNEFVAWIMAGSATAANQAVQDSKNKKVRYNTVMDQPSKPIYKVAVIEFKVPQVKNGGTDKGADGHRVDSIPIANGVIKTGASCEIINYDHDKHDEFAKSVFKYDAVMVRINPGQLSQGTSKGTQERFDNLMNEIIAKGKLVWSSPDVQTKMGAKDALVSINKLSCGLPDTLAYYTKEELEAGFKKNCAFQPRVIKQNRGSAGEGIWLCWLEGKDYCKKYGDANLDDKDKLKLMEMNDNHVEYHTVGEFLEFCVNGPGDKTKAGKWESKFPGKYLEGGKAAGGQLVDQRLCPRISEGEVRMLMVADTLNMIIHKKPEGGLSAVGGNSAYTYYKPGDPKYKDLEHKFFDVDLPQLKKAIGIEGQPLPILWTADFIPLDGETKDSTVYTVGEFNCSCVGISKFMAVCGGEKTLADVSDEDYWETIPLTDLIGKKAMEMLDESKTKQVETNKTDKK